MARTRLFEVSGKHGGVLNTLAVVEGYDIITQIVNEGKRLKMEVDKLIDDGKELYKIWY